MIPAMNIVAWSKNAPWAEQRQIEQDLIISRALVELFNDPFLAEQLRFRGGTALNKLHFPKPLRYSEDIDLVKTAEGPLKNLITPPANRHSRASSADSFNSFRASPGPARKR